MDSRMTKPSAMTAQTARDGKSLMMRWYLRQWHFKMKNLVNSTMALHRKNIWGKFYSRASFARSSGILPSCTFKFIQWWFTMCSMTLVTSISNELSSQISQKYSRGCIEYEKARVNWTRGSGNDDMHLQADAETQTDLLHLYQIQLSLHGIDLILW